jgi:hypothetical protein
MVAFLQAVLGLTASQEGSDFAAFQLPEGGTFEVFGPRDQDHAHFSTGPVVGFVVDDLAAAVRELEAAGVELLGGRWTSACVISCWIFYKLRRLHAEPAGWVERQCCLARGGRHVRTGHRGRRAG